MSHRMPVTREAAEILTALWEHIDRILLAYRLFGDDTRWAATDMSPVAREKHALTRQLGPAGLWDERDASHAAAEAVHFTNQAADYLRGIAALLRAVELDAPLAPVTRSLLELVGHVYWLLDPRLSDSMRDRAARVYLSRLGDVTRAKTAALAVKHPDAPRFGKAVRDLRRNTLNARFYPSEIEIGKSGAIRVRDQSTPGLAASLQYIEEVTGQTWNTEGMYAILSNSSHPTLYAAIEGLRDPNSIRLELADTLWSYKLTRVAMLAFVRAWGITAAYHGLDHKQAGTLGEAIDGLPTPDPSTTRSR